MTSRPVSIREPELGALGAGTMRVLVRPRGGLTALRPGDLMWVREPFHLERRYEGLSPTAAVALGVRPLFAADPFGDIYLPGRRRSARELPKAWHRRHLVVDAIDSVPLHGIAFADLAAAGWSDRSAFEIRWDADVAFHGRRLAEHLLWSANPDVLRIAFTSIDAPMPGDPVAHPVQPEGA